MGYSKEVYLAAATALSEQKARAEQEAEAHRTELYSAFPRAGQIERELASTAITAARAVLGGANAKEHLSRLKERNQALQKELDGLLEQAGLPKDFLEPHYACSYCSDTGYVDGHMCSCLKKRLRAEAYKSLNALTPLLPLYVRDVLTRLLLRTAGGIWTVGTRDDDARPGCLHDIRAKLFAT